MGILNKLFGKELKEQENTNEWVKSLLRKMQADNLDILPSEEDFPLEIRKLFRDNNKNLQNLFGKHYKYMLFGMVYTNIRQFIPASVCLAKYILLSNNGPERRDAIRLFIENMNEVVTLYGGVIDPKKYPTEMEKLRNTECELLTKGQ